MFRGKKTAIALFLISNTVVYAGSMGPVCNGVNSTVPCESKGWSVAGKALYLKASANTSANFVVAEPPEYNPQLMYHWGFELEAAYKFNTGNDLNLNWYHMKGSRDMNFGPSPSHYIQLGSDKVSQSGISGTSQSQGQWDAANIEVGQHVNYGENKSIRFHGGAQFAHLYNEIDLANQVSLTSNANGNQIYSRTVNSNRSFNGFGPRVGADLSYTLPSGFGLYANAATTLLAGTTSIKDSFQGGLGNNKTGISDYVSSSLTVVVPEIDAKLGVNYTHKLAQGDLAFDAGWFWTDYLSVLNASTPGSGGLRYDVGLQGLYFGMKWLGNLA